MNDHQKPAAFRRMAHGKASPAEARAIVRHLLAGCSRCLKVVDKIRRELGDSSAWDYDSAFDRVQERVVRQIEAENLPVRQVFAAAAPH